MYSCNNSRKPKDVDCIKNEHNHVDTLLIKIESKIDNSYEIDLYSRKVFYSWVSDKDTLDFSVGLTEYARDSTISIRFYHDEPILFSDALDKLNDCYLHMKEDFKMDRLNYLYLKPPIFYKDLNSELSKSYKSQFGTKNIKYQKLNEFLMESWLEERVSDFLKPYGKTTRRYGIEKFHLLEKDYYDEYIPDSDMNDYPSFSIHGMGLSIIINE